MADFVIVMGVSGTGKTTIARGIAYAMDWIFAEGDDFHPKANIEKMKAGTPLTDEDRWPWLRSIGQWISDRDAEGSSAVVTCSALKRSYRDLLREGHPGVRFCHVDVPREVLQDRLAKRTGHYMPPSLLPSQLADLERLGEDEQGVAVRGDHTPNDTLALALSGLGLHPVRELPPPEGALEAIEAVGPFRNV